MVRKGFTLIELLIVLSIIGVLATFYVSTFPGTQKKARDTQRKSDLRQYQTALEIYANANNSFYPVQSTTVDLASFCGTLNVSACIDDPKLSDGHESYKYQSDTQGVQYVLWARLENKDEYWANCSSGAPDVVPSPISVSGGNCPTTAVATPTPSPTPTSTPSPSPSPTPPGDPWWNTAWSYRKKVTIASSQVAATLTNFPVLISITDADLSTKAQADGDDIVFADVNAVKLDHEIERYTSGSGNLVAWVEVASLSSSADTILYMYYGNGTATNQQNVTGTWDANFMGVWHLSESSGTTAFDSTSNNNDCTIKNSPVYESNSLIDGGYRFADDDSVMDCGSSTTLNPTGGLTVEVWGNPTTASTITRMWSHHLLNQSGVNARAGVYDGTSWFYNTDGAITNNAWNYIVSTWAPNTVTVYLNGISGGGTAGVKRTGSSTFAIGARHNGSTTTDFEWVGLIDEVRVSSVARSVGYINTSYNNQSSPGTFYTLGSEELALVPDGVFLAKIQQILTAIAQTTQQVLGARSWIK